MNILEPHISKIALEHPYLSFAALYFIYILSKAFYTVLYRLYLSPLAKFPGPKIAAATHLYEFYYNFWLKGQYIFEIEKMHREYGPIVRVNPDLISIHDPDAYSEIYVLESKRKTENYSAFAQGIGFDGSHFLTQDHDLHRKRRRPLEPYFSRAGILRLQPLLAETTEKLNNRLEALKGTGKIVRLDHAFFAMSGDVVGKLCWEDKQECLEHPDFMPEWYNLVHSIIKSIYLFQMFPYLAVITHYLPKPIVLWLMPKAKAFDDFDELTLKSLEVAKQAKIDGNKRDPFRRNYASLFHWIINSDMPVEELNDKRLANEAQVIQSAGSTSTARSLTHIVYYILANPDIKARLTEELRDTMANWPEQVPNWVTLENLPYLQACLKEGLRHSYSTMHPLPRVSPGADITYKHWTIPAGTAVGMSAYLMHTDPEVFSDPFTFAPDRWLPTPTTNMMRNFVPFTRGSRNCLGQNLAQSELSLALAVLFRPGAPKLVLYKTDHTDTDHVHDYIVPLPKIGTKGVRVTVE